MLLLLYKLAAHEKKKEYVPARWSLLANFTETLGKHVALFLGQIANQQHYQMKYPHQQMPRLTEAVTFPLEPKVSAYLTYLATMLQTQINIFFTKTNDLFSKKPLYMQSATFVKSQDYAMCCVVRLPDLADKSINIAVCQGTYIVLDHELSAHMSYDTQLLSSMQSNGRSQSVEHPIVVGHHTFPTSPSTCNTMTLYTFPSTKAMRSWSSATVQCPAEQCVVRIFGEFGSLRSHSPQFPKLVPRQPELPLCLDRPTGTDRLAQRPSPRRRPPRGQTPGEHTSRGCVGSPAGALQQQRRC
jgi:hypothetical protein